MGHQWGSWGCPHEYQGACKKLDKECVPLQKGCVITVHEHKRQKDQKARKGKWRVAKPPMFDDDRDRGDS